LPLLAPSAEVEASSQKPTSRELHGLPRERIDPIAIADGFIHRLFKIYACDPIGKPSSKRDRGLDVLDSILEDIGSNNRCAGRERVDV
jgi:hypothetical protein